ncbi:hypothetical protein [Labrys sp. 22185]|uniref:hypothetical protein n=1 Tax=Labrys sp. 22185 TaxID=3453888 RepID=UPI003F849936
MRKQQAVTMSRQQDLRNLVTPVARTDQATRLGNEIGSCGLSVGRHEIGSSADVTSTGVAAHAIRMQK